MPGTRGAGIVGASDSRHRGFPATTCLAGEARSRGLLFRSMIMQCGASDHGQGPSEDFSMIARASNNRLQA